MKPLETTDVKQYRILGNTLRALILLGAVAGLATIGAQAPNRDFVTLTCAYDPASAGTTSDAVNAVPDPCATPAPALGRATATNHAIPDAATAVGTRSGDEIQPPTF